MNPIKRAFVKSEVFTRSVSMDCNFHVPDSRPGDGDWDVGCPGGFISDGARIRMTLRNSRISLRILEFPAGFKELPSEVAYMKENQFRDFIYDVARFYFCHQDVRGAEFAKEIQLHYSPNPIQTVFSKKVFILEANSSRGLDMKDLDGVKYNVLSLFLELNMACNVLAAGWTLRDFQGMFGVVLCIDRGISSVTFSTDVVKEEEINAQLSKLCLLGEDQ